MRRRNGKGTVTNTEEGSDMKSTKLMEFIEASAPSQAKKGVKIRFMHDLGEGTVYWLEGDIEKRLMKYTKAQKLKFAENFFRIGKLKIVNTGGNDPKPLPATVCTNLTWNVGSGWTKVTAVLPTDKNSAREIRPSDIPISKREEEVDQSELEETAKDHFDDEATIGASGRVRILPDATNNETDTESMNNIRMVNDRLEDEASTDFSEISEDETQTSNTIRSLRTSHPDYWITDEKASHVLHKLQKVINGNTANNQSEKANATARLQEVVTDAQYALDLALAAGTLATTAGIARPVSVQYSEELQDGAYKETIEDAKRWLKSTVKKIDEIELNGHELMKYWLGEDARVLQTTKEFIRQAKKEMKRSYTLTRTQAANPRGLGVRPKKPGY